jgi:tetratricopeptide (TPR) repeat protein
MPDAWATHAPTALAYFANLIESANDQIVKGNERTGITILTLEQPNLERYLDWGYEHDTAHTGINRAARATAQLGNYWTLSGERGRPEVLARLERALHGARRSNDTTGEANVLQAIGDVQQFRADRDAALRSYDEALRLYRALGARLGEANVLAALSCLRLDDDVAVSQQLLEQALALRQAINDRYSEGADLGNYGIALLQRGRGAEALPYLQRARAVFADLGMAHLVAQTDQLIALASGGAG